MKKNLALKNLSDIYLNTGEKVFYFNDELDYFKENKNYEKYSILKNNFDSDFYIKFRNILLYINEKLDDIWNENLIFEIENIITVFLKEQRLFSLNGKIINFQFDENIIAVLDDLINKDNNKKAFFEFFIKNFNKFISKENFTKMPNVDGILIYFENKFGDYGFKFEYENQFTYGKIQELIDIFDFVNKNVITIIDDNYIEMEETELIYDSIEKIINVITYNKEISSIELKGGEFKNIFKNIHNFIFENVDFFAKEDKDILRKYFISIYGFIYKGTTESFGGFERKLYGEGYDLIDEQFYQEMIDKMYLFLDGIKKEKTTKK